MRRFFIPMLAVGLLTGPAIARAQNAPLPILPQPGSLVPAHCTASFAFTRSLRVNETVDAGALIEVNERWRALGIPPLVVSKNPDVTMLRGTGPKQSYRMQAAGSKVTISAPDADGKFYALMTLAQLPQRSGHHWTLPCVTVSDAPALAWRVLSDDVSRGPLPTMRYFKERIRTIAAFKMNGYSPYMEHVFADPRNPLPAPVDGITPAQLHELDVYAHTFHVAFIPEQQTFAHMHNTLRWEEYAPMAELPHGYLLSPENSLTLPYLSQVIADELRAVAHPPFFHIGSDEPSDLGRGQTKAAVDAQGDAAVYAAHITAMQNLIAASGARMMVWDDAIQGKPDILRHIPRRAVIVNWHYGNEKTFAPFIATMASRGFDQMVAPGANNWNEIYPDLQTALPNERTFINQGKAAHVLGLFQTVWHDDGETLYEATWYPVLYAAAAAWDSADVSPQAFARDFPAAFFGDSGATFSDDIAAIGDAVHRLGADRSDSTDYLFWSDPLDARIAARLPKETLSQVRTETEGVLNHLARERPRLHGNAAAVMALAARRLNYLARDYQIASEARYYYDDAMAHANDIRKGLVYRGLYIAKYNFWEMRDNMEELAPLYAAAWNYESRGGHLASNLERYHRAAQQAIERADKINAMTFEDYLRGKHFPTFDQTLGLSAH